MRVIAASTGGAGHVTPLLEVLDALARRGAVVMVVGPSGLESTVRRRGLGFWPSAEPASSLSAPILERFAAAPPDERAVLMDREYFGRLCTEAMLPSVEAAVATHRPDVVLREPCAYAAAIVATRHRIAHAQVAISAAEIESSVLDMVGPVLPTDDETLVASLRNAPYLTRFPASLDPSPFSSTHRFRVDTAVAPEPLGKWWDEGLDGAPLVYVTFGSVVGGMDRAASTFRCALDAVDGLPARVLLTLGDAFDAAALGSVPHNVAVRTWVSQDRVMAPASVVVCHGGSGTTLGALAAGVPLVILPLFADQPANARRVARHGAALIVEPTAGRAHGIATLVPLDARHLRVGIETVLTEPAYRAGAATISDEMHSLTPVEEMLDDIFP